MLLLRTRISRRQVHLLVVIDANNLEQAVRGELRWDAPGRNQRFDIELEEVLVLCTTQV